MSALERLEGIQRGVRAHLALSSAGLGLLLVTGLVLLRAAPREEDLGQMLPGGAGSPREAAELLARFGVLNTLVLDVEAPGEGRDSLATRGTALAEALRRSGLCADVYSGPTLGDLLQLGAVMTPRRLYLLDDPAAAIEWRLAPERLDQSLAALRVQLAAPQALGQKRELLGDPLGLSADLFGGLAGMAGDVTSYRGQLLSRDGAHLLLVVTPARPGLDARASAELLAWIARESTALPAGPVTVHAVGGPRFSAEAARGLRRDVALTVVTSVVFLMALFLARFRDLRLLLLAQLPLACGMAGGLVAVVAVRGHVHVLTFAFGAVMIGVGIDYPIYLLNAASTAPEPGLPRLQHGQRQAWQALGRGFVTTLIGFLAMLLSPMPGLRELALFGGAGIATVFGVTLVFLVPWVARFQPARWPGIPGWMRALRARPPSRRVALALTAALLALTVRGVPRLRFDGELRHLDAQRPEVLAEYEQVMARFGLSGSGSLAVVRGATAEEALARNDAVKAALAPLQASLPGGFIVRSLAPFLPSRATQARRREALKRLDLADARRRLNEGAERAGFTAQAFDGFWDDVASVRDGRTDPLTPDAFAGTSLEPLVKRLLRCDARGCIAVSPLELHGLAQARTVARALPEGATLLDGNTLAADVVAGLPRQMALLTGVGLLLNVGLLWLAYRSLKLAVWACLPCLLGLAGTLAILALTATPLNLVSAGALVLVLGCGVDYGIFVVQELVQRSARSAVESTGVVLASVSTLGGFGTLTLAAHPALHTLGTAVGLGVAISALAALFLLPGLSGLGRTTSGSEQTP